MARLLLGGPDHSTKGRRMSVAKITEITSESDKSFDDAMRVGLQRACKTIQNVEGAWLKDQQLLVRDGNVTGYRVTMKLTFVLKD